jgi:preprotein translocase subunit Sss1
MAVQRIKPAKPQAVLSAIVGLGMLGFAIYAIAKGDANPAFIALWVVALIGIVGFNLWAAFAKDGHTYSITSSSSDDR